MYQTNLKIKTNGRQILEITEDVQTIIKKSAQKNGLCNLFIQHTSASLIICENADPDVLRDLENFMSRLIVDGDPLFQHRTEGKDDMSAHIRSIITQTSLNIPISDNHLALGNWQGVFLWEHRFKNFLRHIIVTIIGN